MKFRKERNQFVAFYVSEEEKALIVKMAKESDMSISDFCRKTLLNSNNVKDGEYKDE